MVAEQGETVNKIEKATENAALDVEEGTVQIKQVIYNLYNPINSRSKIAFLTISSQAISSQVVQFKHTKNRWFVHRCR